MQQILQWLLKITQEKTRENTSTPTHHKETVFDQDDDDSKHIILLKHCRYRKSGSVGGSKPFIFVCRKDIAKACFCTTLQLKRPSNFLRSQNWINSMKMKKEDIAKGLGISNNSKMDSNTHVGNKVLPITHESILSTSASKHEQCSTMSDKKEKSKGDKTKTLSKMKELLRWAAAAKSEKGGKFMGRKVLLFRNRGTPRAIANDDDQLSTESPKISFRWDVQSCSTATSVYSPISVASSLRNDRIMTMSSLNSTTNILEQDHFPPRRGNWITTDSEFVVLEL